MAVKTESLPNVHGDVTDHTSSPLMVETSSQHCSTGDNVAFLFCSVFVRGALLTVASEPVVPETFNLVGSPYSDNQCSTRTGGEHVVPGSAFGVGSGVCDKSFLSRGRLYALSKCMSDGSVFSQVGSPFLFFLVGSVKTAFVCDCFWMRALATW